MAEEGQKLTVAEGGQARLQLLGSSKEKLVKGNASFVISKANLEKEGQSLSRGSIAVADEIGTLTGAGSASARRGGVKNYQLVGLALDLPPTPVEGGWKIAIPLDKIQIPAGSAIEVTVTDLTDSKATAFGLTVDRPTDSLIFEAGALTLGHRYKVSVKGPRSGYTRYFQVLTPQEREDLAQTARAMRVAALESGELSVLLRLANFYSGFDETEKVADVLIEAVNAPAYKELNEQSQLDILSVLNECLRSLDRKGYAVSD
jgi:hypothetical protein